MYSCMSKHGHKKKIVIRETTEKKSKRGDRLVCDDMSEWGAT
jgi:hypothetical protein